MKKRIFAIIAVLLLLSGTAYAAATAAFYTLTPAAYPVMLNGGAMSFGDAVPMVYNGRTMVSLRAVGEALGASVVWDGSRVQISTFDIEKLKDVCVMVKASRREGNYTYVSQGSGVLIDYDKILTAKHVLEGYSTYTVNYDDSDLAYISPVFDTASAEDTAILTPPDKTKKPAKLGDSDEIKLGDKVYIVNCPKGEKNVVDSGTVTGVNVAIGSASRMVISTVTQRGSSGGAVFNVKGELIGIINSGNDKSSFVVPINNLRKALAN